MTFPTQSLAARATEAARRHDLARALDLYRQAVGDARSTAEHVALVEAAAVVARHWVRPMDIEPMVAELLGLPLTAGERGRALFSRALVLGWANDAHGRARALHEARAAFADDADDSRAAKTLGALAVPLDDELTVDERISLGREGLGLAERANDRVAYAHCAGNLAWALLIAGEVSAFNLWEKAVQTLDRHGTASARDDAVRYRSQWMAGAIAWGDHTMAARALKDARAHTTQPFWMRRFASHAAVLAWREGRWEDALIESEAALAAPNGTDQPTGMMGARAVKLAITTEREVRPAWDPSVHPPRELLAGAAVATILTRLRAQRREPNAARDLYKFLGIATKMRARCGWQDLLVVAAELDPPACRDSLEAAAQPAGPRAEACELAARATLSSDRAMLLAAADAFAGIDPMQRARCLLWAARTRERDTGHREIVAAAEIFHDLGARRSLANLLRGAPRLRALERFASKRRYAAAPGLTRREREIAELAARAHTAREIAESLTISEATVRSHLARVKQKLGARKKSDLVRLLAGSATR